MAAKCAEEDFIHKDIVIIGAGISGLSCAKSLKEFGFQNVKVLEARDRIGGRMCTINHGTAHLELGAAWIHGEDGNAIYEIAAKNNLIDFGAPDYMASLTEFSNLSQIESEIFKEAFYYLEDQLRCPIPHSSSSLQPSIWSNLKKGVQNIGKCLTAQSIDNFVTWYQNLQCELNGCNTVDELSIPLVSMYKELPGQHTVELKNGFIEILNLLMENLPKQWILLHKNVVNVNWGTTIKQDETNNDNHQSIQKPTRITCEDGSIILADHVVVTVPIGCLKSNLMSMFTPSLPDQKQVVINSLGFGVVNKIYLKFNTPFWQPTDIFNVVLHEDEYLSLDFEIQCSTSYEENSEQKDKFYPWYRHINRFAYVPNQPRFLCAWITGKGAEYIENATEKEIVAGCKKLLEVILKIEIPAPISVIRSSWKTDQFSCGSYSFLSTDCEKSNVTTMDMSYPLFSNFKGKKHLTLQFAGEATHPHYFGTVHGAYETGIREANRIFSFYCPSEKISPPVGCYRSVDCVIVGAGVAGLACAKHLLSSGIKDILILEASDRIGGRIYTKTYNSTVLELGAQWIHGEDGNKVFQFCNERHMIHRNKEINEGKGKFCTTAGEVVPASIVNEIITKMNNIKACISKKEYQYSIQPLSILSVFENEFLNYMNSCNDSKNIAAIKWAIFKWFLRFETIDNACDDLDDIDTCGYAKWSECEGFYYNAVKNGFRSFTERLMEEFPPNIVITSSAVKHIQVIEEYKGKRIAEVGPVVLESVNGDFYSSYVVVLTSSIGFLKMNMDTLFLPGLSEMKKTAISKMGYGTINKIFIEFSEPVLEKDTLGVQLLWLENSEMFKKFCEGNSWVSGITGFDRVYGDPNLLLVWIGGLQAKEVELVPDEEIIEKCVELLQIFLPEKKILCPIKIIRSSWNSNQYMKGSLSYIHKEFVSSGCSVANLRDPLKTQYVVNRKTLMLPAVLFAGEAMSDHYFGTVHGAYDSGLSSAKEVLNCLGIYKNMRKP